MSSHRPFLRTLGLLCAATLFSTAPLGAQQSPSFSLDSSPSPTPAKKKADPNGLGLMQKDRPKGAKTEITSQEQATFDNATSIATFEGKVIVKDPQFNLFCDKLIAMRIERLYKVHHFVSQIAHLPAEPSLPPDLEVPLLHLQIGEAHDAGAVGVPLRA